MDIVAAAFPLPVRVLGRLFRRLFLTQLLALYDARRLSSFGTMAPLAERRTFLRHLSPVRKKRWIVYAKSAFAGPEAVLACLSRYTHRVAISNQRLLAFGDAGVTVRYKDYRRDDADRQRVMTLDADELSAVSCSMSYRGAFTASGTMACLPGPPGEPASRSPASCSMSCRMPRRRRSTNRSIRRRNARAAAAR